MVTTLTPTALTDSLPLEDAGTHLVSSVWGRLVLSTEATSLRIDTYNDLADEFPVNAQVGLWVDGVWVHTVNPSAEGLVGNALVLPAGLKTIEVVAGPQTKQSGQPLNGSFPVSVTANRPMTQLFPDQGQRLLIYGDSISVGDGAGATLMRDGYPEQIRRARSGSTRVEAWGFRSLYDDATDATARAAFVARVTAHDPDILWMSIGTNDYGLSRWPASAFGTAYGALLDDLHAARPALEIHCMSPIVRSGEGANNLGNSLPFYRSQISTACSTRTFATFHDGQPIVAVSDLLDGVHPTAAGHSALASYILAQL